MPGGGPRGRDYRWRTLAREDAGTNELAFEDVRKLIADVGGYVEGPEGPATNVLASFVEYGATIDDTIVTFGSDPDGKGIAANGALRRVRLGDAFTPPLRTLPPLDETAGR
jgi:hypothetical protein